MLLDEMWHHRHVPLRCLSGQTGQRSNL